MPLALAMDKLTSILTTEAIQTMLSENPEVLEQLREPNSLIGIATQWGGLEPHEVEYLEKIPRSLREGVRAAVVEVAAKGKPIHLQYSPGYDFSVQMWDYKTALSVHVTGPYPPSFPREGYDGPDD
ncbi:MAG TPA: hypothetical protein VHI95_06645 [Acidimicrobiales bacterium]|jgi:hypothetical protein|nr:hypothetical protein [Acidimicrobiales bacterium]